MTYLLIIFAAWIAAVIILNKIYGSKVNPTTALIFWLVMLSAPAALLLFAPIPMKFGALPLVAGIVANGLVMVVNGGYMPVQSPIWFVKKYRRTWLEGDHLKFFSDRIKWRENNQASVGDVLIVTGALTMFVSVFFL